MIKKRVAVAPAQAEAKYREQVARIKADLFSSRPDSLKLSMKERTINTLCPKNRNVLLTYFNIERELRSSLR